MGTPHGLKQTLNQASIDTIYELVRLSSEPDGDIIPTPFQKINRGECDGLPGSLVDYFDAEQPERQFIQFHSDKQEGPTMATVPALVVWFQLVEVA